MKKLILLLSILCVCMRVKGQIKNTSKKDATIILKPGAEINLTQYDSSKEVFSIHFCADTSILKPIDTLYSVSDNIAYQTIIYRFKEGKKDMRLSVKNYNTGSWWQFRSFTVEPAPRTTLFGAITTTYNNANGVDLMPYVNGVKFEPLVLDSIYLKKPIKPKKKK